MTASKKPNVVSGLLTLFVSTHATSVLGFMVQDVFSETVLIVLLPLFTIVVLGCVLMFMGWDQ